MVVPGVIGTTIVIIRDGYWSWARAGAQRQTIIASNTATSFNPHSPDDALISATVAAIQI